MNADDENRIKQLFKQAVPPVASGAESARDLWPVMLRRLDEDAVGAPTRAIARPVPWFDWALIGGLAVFALAFPATIPVFLYYL